MTRGNPKTLLRHLAACDSGTAMTEAALVLIPLLFFLLLMPALTEIWIHEQAARTEAHRDMFDKTTTFILIPEPFTSTNFDTITARQRRHVKADRLPFPAPIPQGAVDAPDPPNDITLGPRVIQPMPEGWPNQYVEGWKYTKAEARGAWFARDVELLRYGVVMRSPWTWLGWPFVPIQDAVWEPPQIHAWYEGMALDDSPKEHLKLIDD